tara:strand:- start:15103 stop:15435 length:333 start_codon:yes stop_codon:yes gene_type:complete
MKKSVKLEDMIGKDLKILVQARTWNMKEKKNDFSRKIFVGTLTTIRQSSLVIEPWFEVLEVKDGRIVSHKDTDSKCGKYIMHSGTTKEMLQVDELDYSGGPWVDGKPKRS